MSHPLSSVIRTVKRPAVFPTDGEQSRTAYSFQHDCLLHGCTYLPALIHASGQDGRSRASSQMASTCSDSA